MKNKGFSLVELIVVIAIMAILVGVAVPVYTGYIQNAKEAKDQQYLGELSHAAQVFAAENNLELQSILVAPEVNETQGIVLFTTDGKAYKGDLSALYGIVGSYNFETIEVDEMVYFTPAVENDGVESCTHEETEVIPGTCIKQGYTRCKNETCLKIMSLGEFEPHTFGSSKIFGNMNYKQCSVCGHVEVTFSGDNIGG